MKIRFVLYVASMAVLITAAGVLAEVHKGQTAKSDLSPTKVSAQK